MAEPDWKEFSNVGFIVGKWRDGGFMTEQEWLGCKDVGDMDDHLYKKITDRKGRLFACACARRLWDLMTDPLARPSLEFAERCIEGQATQEACDQASKQLGKVMRQSRDPRTKPELVVCGALAGMFTLVSSHSERTVWAKYFALGEDESIKAAENDALCDLLRDIIDPFDPVALDPSWLTWNNGIVPQLAAAAYEERSLPAGTFDNTRLAILADALEEAGCQNQKILGHLHRPGVHVRGCWVVDAFLGKE